MADAITFQVNLGNGALNLAYNEVVRSQYKGTIMAAAINALEWSVLIVSDPNFLIPWIVFRDAWNSNSALKQETTTAGTNGVNVYSITANGSGLASGILCVYNHPINYSGTRYNHGLNLLNALLIIAK